ncbi:MAG: hypothetical protein ACE15C_05485 [Phycisphaerae bacterium]
MNIYERLLRVMLVGSGATCLLATGAVFMPGEWMAAAHQWLGIGRMPHGPVVEYLARSASGLYAMLGGLMVLVGLDVRRHAKVITYLGIAWTAFGVAVTWIDIAAGLPNWWVWGEGGATVGMGLSFLVLQRLARHGHAP